MGIPQVSIITPTYNSAKFIKETIQSVQAQTFTNWEMIIVDDCSKDMTTEIIENIVSQDSRVKLLTLKKNSGPAVARNKGINEAKGRFIAFIDSDDLWLSKKLEVQLEFMTKNEIAFSYSQYRIINEDSSITEKIIKVPKQIDYKSLLKNTIIGCLTVMLDTNKIGKIEMPLIRSRQDTAMWLKILKKGYIAYGIQEELARYRIVKGSVSSNKIKAAKNTWKVYREVEQLSLSVSFWCFLHYGFNAIKKR